MRLSARPRRHVLWRSVPAFADAAAFAAPAARVSADSGATGAEAEAALADVPEEAQVGEPIAAVATDQVTGTPRAIGPLELQMLALVNGARITRGLLPLEWYATLAAVARAPAADMMTGGFVSHTGSDGTAPRDRLRRAGVQFQYASENIWTYWGRNPAEGPSTMHAAMMAEPHAPGLWNHIGNILYAGYRRMGIGIVVAPSGVQYLAEVLAD
ncbi:MAG: hypothetical protein HY332_18070 [Chloroflexi bacterium]|nr:hypothetical protein [Chloroflexota bacterium]